MKNITNAFIFGRANSKTIRNKNLTKINNLTLIEHAIKICKKIKTIDNIYVSSDSDKILKLAKKYNINQIQRPAYLCTDNASEFDAWKHAVRYVFKEFGTFNTFVSVPPTSPLRNVNDIINCISKRKNKIDMVFSISKSNNNPFYNMIMLNNKKKIIHFNDKKKFISNKQNYNSTYNITTVAYAANPKFILKAKNIFDGQISYNIVPKSRSLDIDDKEDLELARKLLKK